MHNLFNDCSFLLDLLLYEGVAVLHVSNELVLEQPLLLGFADHFRQFTEAVFKFGLTRLQHR